MPVVIRISQKTLGAVFWRFSLPKAKRPAFASETGEGEMRGATERGRASLEPQKASFGTEQEKN